MNQLLPFIVVGVASGSIYGLAGIGLVLTYKTSGVFNFAHGAMATAAAFVFYALWVQEHLPWPVAALISTLLLGVVMGVGFERLGRRLSQAPLVWQVVATVGIFLIVQAVCIVLYGVQGRPFPHFLPVSTFRLLGTQVTWEQLILTVVSLAATAALFVFFRAGRTGKAMRAVVDDPDLMALTGTSPSLIRRYAWVIGSLFAAISGLLLAPSTSLNATTLTLLVVQAFGAAAIGRFTSLPMTWLGGLGIGVGAAAVTKYFSGTSLLGGLPASLPFVVLFLVLLLYPGLRSAVKDGATRPALKWQAPGRVQAAGGIAVLIFLIFVPQIVGFHLTLWTTGLTSVILFLSLGLLVRTSGQVSLCHAGFAAVGCVAFSKLTMLAHIPWIPALILAGLVVVPIGALVSIPAIRLSGLYLALATFGFGLLLQNMFYQSSLMFGSDTAGIQIPLPSLSWLPVGTITGFYYVVLVVAVLCAIAVVAVTRSRLGRLLRGLADSPTGLVASGTSTNVTRVLVFCISAFVAGISGALLGSTLQYASGSNFDPLLSLTYIAVLLISVGNVPWYALLAAFGVSVLPGYIPSGNITWYLQIVFGAFAIMAGIGGQPTLPQRIRAAIENLGRTRKADLPVDGSLEERQPAESLKLEMRDLRVRFGGLVAVDGLSLTAETGRIVGLIGPNGAGKTTSFNACCGLVQAASGSVLVGDRDSTRAAPAERARWGLGRTFQQPQLFESLSVLDNVALGREAALATRNPLSHILSRRSARKDLLHRAREAVQMCGLASVADVQVSVLSTGQRRLVELARCLAGEFRLLLLDEPSAGLDRDETEQFGKIIRQVVSQREVGVLLVEHDMSLVMALCDEIYVLDFGSLIYHGTPGEVQASITVREAYLGSESHGAPPRIADGQRLRTDSGNTADRTAAPPAIELRGVSAGYGRTAVVRDVSLVVPSAGVTALLGSNGAGKTTTLRVAAGLLAPSNGAVLIDGEDVTRMAPQKRTNRGICLIPEGRGIFRSLTVRENLELQVLKTKAGPDGIDRALAAFPVLGSRLSQTAGSLSGGEQQMLAVSRAYLSSPRVVLLDEVSLGLAPLIVDEVFESLRNLASTGVALLLVEQYVSRALELADQACVMTSGRISWSGSASDLDPEIVTSSYLGRGVTR